MYSFSNLIDFFANKATYCFGLLLATGLAYYSKITSLALKLNNNIENGGCLDIIINSPIKFYLGFFSILISISLFLILSIASFHAFKDVHIILSILFCISCISCIVFNWSSLSLFTNSFLLFLFSSFLIIWVFSSNSSHD